METMKKGHPVMESTPGMKNKPATKKNYSEWKSAHPAFWVGGALALGLTLLALFGTAALLLLFLANSPAGESAGQLFTWLLAANTTQVTWYVTRAAGLTAYLLLWLSTAWGLAVSNRILDGQLHGTFTYDFHQFISWLSIGFVVIHIVVLTIDQYLTFSVAQVLIPGLSAYRPLWVAVGIVTLYITLLVTVTFYIRDRIGMKAFRAIHVLSLLGFVGAGVHGLFAGTDSPLPLVKLMYAGTFLSVVFLTVYWVAVLYMRKRKAPALAKAKRANSTRLEEGPH